MSPNPLRQQAYQHIQQKILSGEIPAGQVISELTMAKELGISRTPIREAIRRLEHEGVLESVPRFGTVVRRLERRDLVELYELREALEPYAVAHAAHHLSEDDRVMLHKLCEEVKTIADEVEAAPRTIADAASMRRLLSADLGFHMLLLRVSGNRRMMKIVADSRLLTRIFGTPRQEHDLVVLRETYRFHREILDAVESGDGETARRLMAEHIVASRREALEHYDRTHSGGDTRTIPLGLPEDLLEDLNRIERGPSTPPARKPRKSAAS